MEEQQQAKQEADSERELVRLWRAWRTVHEMVQDRVRGSCKTTDHHNGKRANFPHKGYELAEEEVRISLEDFRAQYSDPLGGPECAVLLRRNSCSM